MTIDGINDLRKVIRLCRDHGVTSIEIDGIKLQLSLKQPAKASRIDYDAFPEASIPVPRYTPVNAQDTASEPVQANIDMPDELTEEQAMFYSAVPEARQ